MTAPAPTLSIWFAYGSTYAYLTVMRIEEVARERGIVVDWRPFNLIEIFKEMGFPQGPFVANPAKLKYMWRDLERRAQLRGLPYRKPSTYPPKTFDSALVGCVAAKEGWCAAFTRAVFHLRWVEGIEIGTEENLRGGIARAGRSVEPVLTAARAEANVAALRNQTETAKQLGIFGSPTFVANGELFWGDDRLDDALDYAAKSAREVNRPSTAPPRRQS